jgi:formamidopyrimidine-DNA glycosylase
MPELPEVETIVRTLRPHLAGAMIVSVDLRRTDILTPTPLDLPAALAALRIVAVSRRGKRILIALDNRCTLAVHLGMTGRLTVEPPDTPVLPHTHLVIGLIAASSEPKTKRSANVQPTAQLRFRDPRRFGRLRWLCPGETTDSNLGPEPLEMRRDQLGQALARTRRAIKTALLDQTLIAGIGNIYADEALFAAAIHPLTPANRLTPLQIGRLMRGIKSILRKAIRHGGSTLRDYVDAQGKAGAFQKLHNVYARTALPCRRCRIPISRIILTGRSTHFCPKCQPRT